MYFKFLYMFKNIRLQLDEISSKVRSGKFTTIRNTTRWNGTIKMNYSRLSIIRNPRDYKKNSNYRDFELSRSLNQQEEREKKRIIKSFYYIFENMYEPQVKIMKPTKTNKKITLY